MSSQIQFCKDDFWNEHLSWRTTTPKLTKCLNNVGLNIIPNTFFIFIILIEFIYIAQSKNKCISINKFNVTRFLICLFAIVINLILLINYAYPMLFSNENQFTLSDLFSSISKIAISLILIIVHHYQRTNGIITSGITFTITLLLSIIGGVCLLDTISNESMYTDFEQQNVYRYFLCIFSLFILNCFADDAIDAGLKQNLKKTDNLVNKIETQYQDNDEKLPQPCPKQYCSFLSRISFYWYTKFVRESAKKEIELNDIYEVEEDMKVINASKNFNKEYFKELESIENINRKSNKNTEKFNTWRGFRVLFRVYIGEFMFISLAKLMFDILNFTSPVLLSLMIRFIKDKNSPKWVGLLIVLGFVVGSLLKNILINYYFERGVGIGIKIKSALTNLIFSKSFTISPKSRKDRTIGEIVNLISVDTSRFAELAPFVCFIWSAPLQIIIGTYLLYQQLGTAVFAGLGVIIAIIIFNSVLLHFLKKFYLKEMKIKDERIKLVSEVLNGIRIIKLYAWESAFLNKINKEREKEVKNNKNGLFIELFSFFFFAISPTLVLVVSISVYIFGGVGIDFDAEKAFVSIALFNILQFPLEILPVIFTYITMCRVSLKRISSFLAEEELDNYIKRRYDNEMALTMKKAKFVWGTFTENSDQQTPKKNHKKIDKVKFKTDKEKEEIETSLDNNHNSNNNNDKDFKSFALDNIEFDVKKNSFTAIIGQVGSGKSSLISAILGDMHLIENDLGIKGKVNISEEQSICYVAQQAWIQNASFRDNILFGKEFNAEQYEDVIRSCALEPDLKQFEAGDETEIGEKGINLSGGQKQRVSLARACYQSISTGNKNQMILLDDPLSAVDAHVGKHLCENVFSSKTGLLKDTTRILVTNQLNQLSDLNVDQIILLKDGKIELKCTFDELIELDKNGQLDEYDLKLKQNDHSENQSIDEEDKKSIKSNKTTETDSSTSTSSSSKKEKNGKKQKDKSKIIESETVETGRVDLSNYKVYFKYFGYTYSIVSLVLLILDNIFSVWSRDYLAYWTKSKIESDDIENIKETNKNHIFNYIYISLFQCIFNLVANYLLVLGCVSTIIKFHKNLLYKVLRSPVSFFDSTPIGRVINRFSKDIDAIDKALPRALREFLTAFLNLAASIIIILIKQPSTFIFYFLIFVIYYFILDIYIISSRQLKRFESVTRSPIYSSFSECLNGVSTIKAYKRVQTFEKDSINKMELNNRANWYSFQGNRWLGFYLDLIGSLILLVISIQFVLKKETSDAGNVGLLISYALNISLFLSYVVKFYSMFEANAVSIERINEYTNNEEEAEWIEENNRPPLDWPKNGEIKFENYSTRYRESTNLILKNLNFKIESTDKIGVVGRTGAGKSTITLALFRVIEPVEGKIIIDEIDISKIGLHDLRSKLSIIPQDPVLFTGTIRFNLDPFDKYSDKEIYESLEHAHLKQFVNSLEDGILHKISEGGENLSVGQRQLICLARALLRKSKILVLDEATASVDFSTDELVQKTIRSEFKNCTTITIAHRLNTVLDSNRILVLDKGELKEYDKPDILLANQNSQFYHLASKANIV